MKISDMDYSEMEGGRCAWTLSAAEAQYYQKDQVSMLQSVRLKFFLKDGGIIHLSSDKGKLYAGSKNIELRGSIVAVLPDGYELRTETADYDHALKTISSKDPISMRSREVSLDGTGWLYKIQEGRALVEKGVKATLCGASQATDGSNPGPTAGCGQ